MKAWLAFALMLGSAQAAESPAYTLYADGKYAQAEAAGEAQGDAAGFAMAARAGLAAAMLRETPCMECLALAEKEARRAIALDPKLAEAHVFLAAALGYESRILGPFKARLNGYPEEAKDNLDTALAEEPRNGWALAATGAWNIEVVRAGGATLARWLYGASLDAGLDDYAKAFAAAPDNLVLRYQYALSLGGLGVSRYRPEIADALARAVTLKPATAYERFAQTRARELQNALKANDDKAFAGLVRRDQGYP